MDKNQALVEFLMTCPALIKGKLFFNFADEEDGTNQVLTQADDVILHKPFVDGSVLKRYTFTIISYKSVAYNPLTTMGYIDENVSDMHEVQEIVDWINEQADKEIYPDFGSNATIDMMETLSDNPDLFGVDTSVNPPLAKYGIAIRIDYLDTNKMIWK